MTETDLSGFVDSTGNSRPADTMRTMEKAEAWINDLAWLNGLKITPHASVNKQQFATQYQTRKKWWDEAFAFLKEQDLANLTPGKYEIDGENVFAIITEAPTKELDNISWESHLNYNDIHYLIKGEEKIGIVPKSSATVTQEYDAAKDLIIYDASGTYYIADPGTFFIMLPDDVHRPGIHADGYDMVKKVVIKIRTAL